jgi:hypothetical protein
MYLDEASYADYIAAYKKFMLEVATVYVSNPFKETVSRDGFLREIHFLRFKVIGASNKFLQMDKLPHPIHA